jgi:hypothetical protein
MNFFHILLFAALALTLAGVVYSLIALVREHRAWKKQVAEAEADSLQPLLGVVKPPERSE